MQILFPPRCVLCDEILDVDQQYVHPGCRKNLNMVEEPTCVRCGRPVLSDTIEFCFDCGRNVKRNKGFVQGKALYLYKGAIKESMYRFKYANRREYAGFFAECAVQQYGPWMEKIQPEVIIPVPMYRKKERKRGYNQAAVFARALAARTQIPIRQDLVFRVKDTTPQKLLNDTERKNNLKKAFQTSESIVKYKKILLVDDIYTTGSTADAVTECLTEAGVPEVYLMNVCIGKGH